jgi:hypothetical protein
VALKGIVTFDLFREPDSNVGKGRHPPGCLFQIDGIWPDIRWVMEKAVAP